MAGLPQPPNATGSSSAHVPFCRSTVKGWLTCGTTITTKFMPNRKLDPPRKPPARTACRSTKVEKAPLPAPKQAKQVYHECSQ